MSDADTDTDDTGAEAWADLRMVSDYAPTRRGANDCPASVIYVARDLEDVPAPTLTSTTFVASTSREDRYLSIVEQDWRLAEYRTNPVILWMHNLWVPAVGRGLATVKGGKSDAGRHLQIRADWDPNDPTAVLLASKYAEGFMHAGSASWKPGEMLDRSKLPSDHYAYRERKDSDGWNTAYLYRKNNLLEFSAVTVPGNADATALRAWAESAEDPEEQVRRAASASAPRATVQDLIDMFKAAPPAQRALFREQVLGAPPAKPPPPRVEPDLTVSRGFPANFFTPRPQEGR